MAESEEERPDNDSALDSIQEEVAPAVDVADAEENEANDESTQQATQQEEEAEEAKQDDEKDSSTARPAAEDDRIQAFDENERPSSRRSSARTLTPAAAASTADMSQAEDDDDDEAPEAVSLSTSRQSALSSITQQQETAKQQRSRDKQRRQALVLGKQREADERTQAERKVASKREEKKKKGRAQQLVDAEGNITEEALLALEAEEAERKRRERAEKRRKEREEKERAAYKTRKLDEEEAVIQASRQDGHDIIAQQSAHSHTHIRARGNGSIQFEPHSLLSVAVRYTRLREAPRPTAHRCRLSPAHTVFTPCTMWPLSCLLWHQWSVYCGIRRSSLRCPYRCLRGESAKHRVRSRAHSGRRLPPVAAAKRAARSNGQAVPVAVVQAGQSLRNEVSLR